MKYGEQVHSILGPETIDAQNDQAIPDNFVKIALDIGFEMF